MKLKHVLIGLGSFAGILVLTFSVGLYELEMFRFFAPKRENIRREVFENTKSYTHGAAQDLGKYFREYQEAEDQAERDAIVSVIRMRFAELDDSKLQSPQLRNFLITARGY